MAHNPQAPQGPNGGPDPAGNTQMFRAFVDEGGPQRPAVVQGSSGPRVGMIIGVIAVIAAVAAAAWFALA
ncbi:hypothetical protein LHJ74_05500 [Streptomyces sp. N2-109]|uniref:Uncharacterized protein n=1 Tax=Streptomyces gossypii TaxID=2883101 RepID=A0ABT2JPT5_9ACTN|nr:hypothetical protein [Streptomyces gossypii]MCT2589390.1 hypothetical protein [Streptomyces gossypii]